MVEREVEDDPECNYLDFFSDDLVYDVVAIGSPLRAIAK
jgi:hypothetical protein